MDRRRGLLLLGLALIAAGLGLWLAGDFSLSARRSPGQIRFAGGARVLAGLAPVLVGVALADLSRRTGRDGVLPQVAVGAGLLAAIAAFLLADRHD